MAKGGGGCWRAILNGWGDTNGDPGRYVAPRWAEPCGDDRVVTHLDGERTANQVNGSVAVVYGRLGMSGDKCDQPSVVTTSREVGVRCVDRGSDRAVDRPYLAVAKVEHPVGDRAVFDRHAQIKVEILGQSAVKGAGHDNGRSDPGNRWRREDPEVKVEARGGLGNGRLVDRGAGWAGAHRCRGTEIW